MVEELKSIVTSHSILNTSGEAIDNIITFLDSQKEKIKDFKVEASITPIKWKFKIYWIDVESNLAHHLESNIDYTQQKY